MAASQPNIHTEANIRTQRQTYTHTSIYKCTYTKISLGHQSGWYLCPSGTKTFSVVLGKHINDRDEGSLEQCPVCWTHTRIRSLTSFTSSHSLSKLLTWPFQPNNRHQKYSQNMTKHVLFIKIYYLGKRGAWIRCGRPIPLAMLSWKSLDLSTVWRRCRKGCLHPPFVMDFAAVLVAATECWLLVEKAVETG